MQENFHAANYHPKHDYNSFQQCNQNSVFLWYFHGFENHYQLSDARVVFQVSQNIASKDDLKIPDEGHKLLLRQEYFLAKSEKKNTKLKWFFYYIFCEKKKTHSNILYTQQMALYNFETRLRCNKKFFTNNLYHVLLSWPDMNRGSLSLRNCRQFNKAT